MVKRTARALGLCVLVCIASLLLFSAPAAAADYTDIQNHWARSVIEKWSDSGILSGFSDGTFRPDAPVTRAQLAAVLYRIWGCAPVEDCFAYPDLSPDDWCYDALRTMSMYGVARNTGVKILPDQPLTREEAFYMIGQTFFLGVNPLSRKDALAGVSDAGDISPQYLETIKWLMIDRYVNGSSDGRLNPRRGITRAEVMKVIDNIVNVYITQPGVYRVHAKQNVLVTCGGVTLQRTDVPAGYANPRRTSFVRNYLFGSAAAEGGVTFENRMSGGGTSKFYLYTVSEQPPTWQADSRCEISSQRAYSYVSSTHVFPDTRFAAGVGREDSPYLIATAEQFRALAKRLDDTTPQRYRYFLLLKDLNLGSLSGPLDANEASHRVFANLDGGGHTVTYQMKNATQTGAAGGLFSEWAGSCSNLTLRGAADVTVSESAPGQTDSISLGTEAVFFGGFSGYLWGPVTNCTAAMDVTVRFQSAGERHLMVGGWTGYTLGDGFEDCMFTGTVKAIANDRSTTIRAGGLLGMGAISLFEREYYELLRCGAKGTVSVQGGEYSMAGGLAGQLAYSQSRLDPAREKENWAIVNCWSTAGVSGSGAAFQCEAGGLVGQIYAGAVRESWARPAVSIDGGSFQNLGAIAGSCREVGAISDCWANASGIRAGGDLHLGGIVGRLDQGTVSNCYILGGAALGDGNAIAFESWNDGTVTASADMTGMTPDAKQSFLQSCGWDFTGIWDQSGTYPILRGCESAPQRAAQA